MRQRPCAGSPSERWNGPLDLEHLAEEVEELGVGSPATPSRSRLRRLIEHALKLDLLAGRRPSPRLDRDDRRRPRRDRRAADADEPRRCRGSPAGDLRPGAPPRAQGPGQSRRARGRRWLAGNVPLCARPAPRPGMVSDQPPRAIEPCLARQVEHGEHPPGAGCQLSALSPYSRLGGRERCHLISLTPSSVGQ